MQLLHPEDAYAVVERAATNDIPGTFNVGGDGVLMLTQAARMLGKPTLPLLPIGFGSVLHRAASFMGTDLTPGVHRLLTYGRIMDTTALREIFGYTPKFSTRETFEWYAETLRPGLFQTLGVTK